MMKSVPALLLLEWEGKGAGGKSARFVLKILHDGGRGLVELGFYENLAAHAEGPGAQGKVHAKPYHTLPDYGVIVFDLFWHYFSSLPSGPLYFNSSKYTFLG